jgi:hypothetical protein
MKMGGRYASIQISEFRMQKVLWLSVFFTLFTFCSLKSDLAAHAASGTKGAAFLDIPVCAGPAALGSAYTALSNDAYAPVWNPAGLTTFRFKR